MAVKRMTIDVKEGDRIVIRQGLKEVVITAREDYLGVHMYTDGANYPDSIVRDVCVFGDEIRGLK